mgnify:FL=1
MGWTEFIIAYGVFFLSHSVPVRPPVKPWLQALLGATGFVTLYSLMSLAVLVWLIGAAERAPFVPLWTWAPWQNHVVLTLMLPVCVILALALARPNPFSFGGARNHQFDPTQPGIIRISRHPLLLALAIWAAAHLAPNGDLAHVILFSTFALFAAFGGRIIDRRKRREMGQEWERMHDAVKATRGGKVSPGMATGLRLVAGLLLYVALIWLHPYLFGVSPLS